VFPEGEQAPERAIEHTLRDQERALESSLADVETDGRVARIELRLRKESVRDSVSRTGHPQITWGVAFDERERTVTFRHEGGERADSARLSVDDVADDATPFDAFDTFGPGDSVTVRIDPAADSPSPRIVYTAPDGNSSMTLFSYSVPEGDR